MLDSDDVITRFITESRHFNAAGLLPKAFQPKFEKDLNRSETSVYTTTGLTEDGIWTIGRTYVEPTRGKTILARADISVADASFEMLGVTAAPPPDGHAVIIGWPEGDDNKDRRKALQLELAARARFRLVP